MKTKYKFKDNLLKYWSVYLFLFVTILQKEINYLFYDSFLTPDLDVYLPYFNYFFDGEMVYREQGILYYYLHALNYNFFYSKFGFLDIFIHKSIQQVNFYIYIFGLIGMYKLFSFLKINVNTIFLTFTFLNLFPPSIAMRLAFKPELLAFALLTWVIYMLEKYKTTNDTKLLLYLIPFIASILTLKGNILVIVAIYLSISYYKLIFNNLQKTTILIFLLFLVNLSFVYLENFSVTNKNILDTQSGSTLEENYNYKASPSVIYKTKLFKLFTSPIKHNHANSFIAITLLETNGDYFDLFWDNDASMFLKNRIEFISFEESKKITPPKLESKPLKLVIFQQKLTDVYLYESIGLILSIYIFYLLFKLIIYDKSFIRFYLAIFVGIAILLINAITGFPRNNFDPLVGDTFKPLYYSFVFIFSFSFVIARGIELKIIKKYQLLIYCIFIILLLGFPKNYTYEIQSQLVPKIQNSIFCEIEKSIYLENSDYETLDCVTSQSIFEEVGRDFIYKPVNLINLVLILLISIKLLRKNSYLEDSNSLFSIKKIKQKYKAKLAK